MRRRVLVALTRSSSDEKTDLRRRQLGEVLVLQGLRGVLAQDGVDEGVVHVAQDRYRRVNLGELCAVNCSLGLVPSSFLLSIFRVLPQRWGRVPSMAKIADVNEAPAPPWSGSVSIAINCCEVWSSAFRERTRPDRRNDGPPARRVP